MRQRIVVLHSIIINFLLLFVTIDGEYGLKIDYKYLDSFAAAAANDPYAFDNSRILTRNLTKRTSATSTRRISSTASSLYKQQQQQQQQQRTSTDENPFKIVNEWKYLDFDYPTYQRRREAIANSEFIPSNNLPLGIDIHENRLFITTPRWKDGVPASFNYLPYPPKELSPALRPYPNWEAHANPYAPDCTKLVSVYRTSIDDCNRLWLIDSGIVNATVNLNQICPPKIVAYNLLNDEQIISYELPSDQIKQESLHSNILVNCDANRCDDAYVYVTDVWRFGIVVYSLAKNRSWRATNYNFNPNPIASDFNVYGLNFQWLDGVFGMSLSSVGNPHAKRYESTEYFNDRLLYFHPMASFKEFMVSTSILHDESLWPAKAQDVAKYFQAIGDRGAQGQSSTSGIDRAGVMFYTLVHRDGVGCWDTAKSYIRSNLLMITPTTFSMPFNATTNDHYAVDDYDDRRNIANGIGDDNQRLIQFPNDLKVDRGGGGGGGDGEQGIWVMSNRLPIYLYGQLDYGEINFRILRANAREAVAGTICDPKMPSSNDRIPLATVQEGECF